MIPGFEVLEEIGRGGMGTVYRARQICLDRIVALKVLPETMSLNADDVGRFKREAKAAALLSHSGIVQIFESGEVEGTYYYAMEYVEGESVADWINRTNVIPEDQALLVAIAVAEALDYAWAKARLIHRDIKPDNVLISREGVVKVADLGLVKMVDSRLTITMPGEALGTPNYCSPEQANADKDIDCRTDIYSLGAMLYHMLTGRVPFGDVPAMSAVVRHITHQLDDPQELNPKLFTGTAVVLEKMMAKTPADRHANWEELLRELKRVHKRLPPRLFLPQGATSTIGNTVRAKGGSPARKAMAAPEDRKKVISASPGQRYAAPVSEPAPAGSSTKTALTVAGVPTNVANASVAAQDFFLVHHADIIPATNPPACEIQLMPGSLWRRAPKAPPYRTRTTSE